MPSNAGAGRNTITRLERLARIERLWCWPQIRHFTSKARGKAEQELDSREACRRVLVALCKWINSQTGHSSHTGVSADWVVTQVLGAKSAGKKTVGWGELTELGQFREAFRKLLTLKQDDGFSTPEECIVTRICNAHVGSGNNWEDSLVYLGRLPDNTAHDEDEAVGIILTLLEGKRQGKDASLRVVSGGVPFPHVREKELAEIGKAALALASSGVEVYLVFPQEDAKTKNKTDAYESAVRFARAVRRALEEDAALKYLEFEHTAGTVTMCTARKAVEDNLRFVRVEPTRSAVGAENKTWHGWQFLSDPARFVYLKGVPFLAGSGRASGKDSMFLMSVGHPPKEGEPVGGHVPRRPFAIEGTQTDVTRFDAWSSCFVPNKEAGVSLAVFLNQRGANRGRRNS